MPSSDQVNDRIKAGKDRFGAELISGVNKLGKIKTEATLNLAQRTTASYTRLLGVIVATVLAGIGIAAYLAVTLPRAVTRPIMGLAKVAEQVARGDMDKPFSSDKIAEFEPLARSLEKMRGALVVMTRKLRSKAPSEVT
jgi:HAMP domain-containing protein